jgi:hypothetical protein
MSVKVDDVEEINKKEFLPPVNVMCRVVFLEIEDVNTKNENYTAEIFIEFNWTDDRILKHITQSKMGKLSKNLIFL